MLVNQKSISKLLQNRMNINLLVNTETNTRIKFNWKYIERPEHYQAKQIIAVMKI
jgi:hypothetical protein